MAGGPSEAADKMHWKSVLAIEIQWATNRAWKRREMYALGSVCRATNLSTSGHNSRMHGTCAATAAKELLHWETKTGFYVWQNAYIVPQSLDVGSRFSNNGACILQCET